MDIHAPDKPIHTWKDFGIHIAVVTIGILIALSLEGLRETVHEHRLVRETRENFNAELARDQENSHKELARVRRANKDLQQLVADLPALRKDHPESIAARVEAIDNPFYFVAANGWQTALSTGALGQMATEEVGRYANVYYIIRIYADMQRGGLTAEDRANAFFLSHPHPSSADLVEGTERIVLFQRAEDEMESVCGQMDADINKVLPAEPAKTKP